jgi:AcrR family transcriptional regulator
MQAKKVKTRDTNAEAKILAAARVVFHKKGYAGTRTRDIAKEANMNLALLNYYFESKEKLFDLVMLETLRHFFQAMGIVFNDETTSLKKKIELVAEKYIDLITAEPEVPLFMMSAIRSHGAAIFKKLPAVNTILQSIFIKQYAEAVKKREISEPNPLHFIMNLIGLVVFPFIGSPLIKKVGKLNDSQFGKLMQERKKLIPVWITAMFKMKQSAMDQKNKSTY